MATRKYSTGPLVSTQTSFSDAVRVQIVNNGKSLVTVRVRAFSLAGPNKTRFFSRTIVVSSNSSSFITFGVETFEFEVQIKVRNGDDSVSKVLVSAFGLSSGSLNPSHRVLHRELKRI